MDLRSLLPSLAILLLVGAPGQGSIVRFREAGGAGHVNVAFDDTFVRGPGSDIHCGRRPVPIGSDAPPSGQMFGQCAARPAGMADASAADTPLTMPSADREIAAAQGPRGGLVGQGDVDYVLDQGGQSL